MIALLVSGLTGASMTILKSVMTKKLFEVVLRKTFITILKKITESTENKVDDDLVKPIIKELEK